MIADEHARPPLGTGPLVPDPARPLFDDHLAPPAAELPPGRRWIAQRRRRSAIFATARLLMAEQGYDQVQLQAVAAHAGVSVQTLYNLIGNRAELMRSAAAEWIFAIGHAAEAAGAAQDGNTVFALLELFWESAISQGGYTANAVRSTTAREILDAPFRRAAEEVLAFHLCRLQAIDALSDRVDVPILARQLASASQTTTREWLNAPYAEREFRQALVNGCGLMLCGALRGSELVKLEHGLERYWHAAR